MYHKWQSYYVRFLRYGVQWAEFFVILDRFLPFYPPNNPQKTKFWEKKKKNCLEILSFYTAATINENYMMYGSWDTKHVGPTFLPFWTIYCTFTPPTTQKIKILKKKRKKPPGDIITLHMCTINDNHMMYGSWDIECGTKFFIILDFSCLMCP